MYTHTEIGSLEWKGLFKRKQILFAGNMEMKIYGSLKCKTGKRMKLGKRVFFISEEEALLHNYRPCGHCLKQKYLKWKDGAI